MTPGMWLDKDIAEAVEKDNMVVFRNKDTKQPYVLFKLKDEKGAVAEITPGLYIVTAKNHQPKKINLRRHKAEDADEEKK